MHTIYLFENNLGIILTLFRPEHLEYRHSSIYAVNVETHKKPEKGKSEEIEVTL